MRIALIQQSASPDRVHNLRRGLAALEEAADNGARLVSFSELAFDRFFPQHPAAPGYEELAETVPGPVTEAFSRRARARGAVVVLNLFERAGGRCFDSSPVIDATGELLGVARMAHITEYELFHESGYYAPGDGDPPVFATAAGRIGVAICYDRHFPEYMRALALGGAELVVVPQAGAVGEWPAGLYEAEMRVAAFQNGYFAALCNRVGREERLEFAGESFVCAPDGRVLARAGTGTEEILYADLDLEECGRSAGQRLFLRHRRPELYGRWLGE
jgi:N-carbamoylputrescine amidase